MSGVTLPAIPGAIPLYTRSLPNGFDSARSRPSSSGSQCSSYSIVPHVYYDHCSFRTPGLSNTPGIPRSYAKLPSLRTGRKSGYNVNTDIRARYSAKFRKTPDPFKNKLTADSPFLNKSTVEDCLKCLLKVPHKRCESHKYIRVGGGYRHGYWYVKCLLEELELQRQRELILKQRLESIREKPVKAIKTYIRTKSGRLVERIIFLSEEDYAAFKEGKNVQDILKKYLSKDEAQGLESWDKDEVKAIKTYVRTKSGRLIEKLVYVSKEDYDAITQGKGDAKALLKKYAKDGEVIEGWDEAKMKTIKTYVRTKSGRLIEKTIMISQEDYDAMIKEGKDPAEILKKYMPLGDGETLESWKSAEPMKAIKTMVRTKSGRLIEKTVYVSADDYERLQKGDADLNDILGKYMGEDGGTVEGWKKADPTPMKVVKTYIRTKSGRLIEKQVLLTEEEYKQFMESGGNPDFLKKFIELEKGEVIDSWEKASTVYSGGDDEEVKNAKEGQRIIGKDGTVYEVVVDPLTGKKYKRKVGKQSDIDSGFESMQKGKGGRGRKGLAKGEIDHEETAEDRRKRKQGKRDAGSDSDYSYRSVYSAGGTRHVRRRRKRADGTRSDSESYHSDQDADGEARRRRRRREREHAGSAHSYYSVTSEGGTRHVMRRRKREDGTYSDPESYHSADSYEEGGRMADKKKKEKEKKEKERKTKQNRGGEDSDHSYYSETSEGGTRRTFRKKKIRDAKGNVIGYEKSKEYDEDEISVYTEVSDGKGGKIKVKKENPNSKKAKAKAAAKEAAKAKLKEKYGKDFDPVFSDCTTDDDDVDLENMTEEEKKAYFEAKAKRAAEREKRRREKYGDKYDEMMAKHQEQKKMLEKEKKKAAKLAELREKGLISPSSDWTIDSDTGEPLRKKAKEKVKQERQKQMKLKKLQEAREKGLISPSSDWTLDSDGEPARRSDLVKQGKRPPPEKGKGKKKGKDGNEADSESEEEIIDPITGKVIKKKGNKGRDEEFDYEYDDKGRIIRKTRRNPKPGDDDGSEYEYEYDEDGNMKVVKKKGGQVVDDSDDEQFEVGADGKIRLKGGKKKINLDKLTDEDLRRLGIDPTLSKAEIARKLKEKFGDDIDITAGKKKIGTKHADEYSSDADTDDLANDSDLDVETLTGTKRVNVKLKKGGQELIEHMKKIIAHSDMKGDYNKMDETGDIDFVSHYKLVETHKIDGYARAFVVEDGDWDTVLSYKESRTALEGVPTIQQISTKQLEYVLKVLNLDDASQITFRMFAVISALCERVTSMDPVSKHLLEIADLIDIQRKMELYKSMFYCNIGSDRDTNYIKAESLRIELIAGGLNWKQQEFIMERLQPNLFMEVSFLDYLVYVPLFLSMHDNICENPLDMSDTKYDKKLRKPSGSYRQRDMNPPDQPLKKTSTFQLKKQAHDLIEGRISKDQLSKEKVELLNKYATDNPSNTPKSNSQKRGSVADPNTARGGKKGGAGKGASKKGKLAGKEKAAYKKGKRNNDSDSDFSYRSVVSAGGTRHVRRRKKNADGTYGDSESYHSSQDEDGEARRRKRRRDREHGSDSDHSYYSVISAGGTRHVRRRKRNPDGTYGDSESYHSGDTDRDNLKREVTKTTKTSEETDSDYSYASERSVGGTRYEVKRKRLRNADGKVIGHGEKVVLGEAVSDADSVRTRRGSIEEGKEPPKHIKDVINDENIVLQRRGIGSIGDISTSGLDDLIKKSKWPGEGLERIASQVPDDFSDATTDDNVDLSKMTEEEREAYLRQREKRRAAREKRRREKYGDKYDEIMKKREQNKLRKEEENDKAREGADKLGVGSRRSSMRRASTNLEKDKVKDRPKSMVTYEKGPPRDLGHNQKIDNREIGLSHESWTKDKSDKSRKGSTDSNPSADNTRRMMRESTMLNKLPSIPQGKVLNADRRGRRGDGRGTNESTIDGESTFVDSEIAGDKKDEEEKERAKSPVMERGADGKLRPKKKKIDINDLDADTLRKLGIDPNLSKKEIAKKLKELFGDDIKITDGDEVIGTKGVDEFDPDMTDEQLAQMEDLDLSTIHGKRRVNILFQRGGSALRQHFERILKACKLREDKAKDIDERDSAIDFLNHYRLVDPMNLDSYAKAFVVEDTDFDTVLNSADTKIALDGIEMLQHMTEKQLDYVFKVLHIDEASQVTFKMFAVITALCERVTNMDELSKHLLDICNLGDVERKLELYKAMFYHNIPSYRDTNYVTSDSLKIELIAGGLNWKQQEFVMEKLEPSRYGEVSFLDYMCYIPLFLSMHDNICYNPLDMSNKKYQMPPRRRPPSAQRDMNPLGQRLMKTSDFLMKRLAKEVAEGKINEDILQPEEREKLKRYAVLPDIRNLLKTEREETADETSFKDLIY